MTGRHTCAWLVRPKVRSHPGQVQAGTPAVSRTCRFGPSGVRAFRYGPKTPIPREEQVGRTDISVSAGLSSTEPSNWLLEESRRAAHRHVAELSRALAGATHGEAPAA